MIDIPKKQRTFDPYPDTVSQLHQIFENTHRPQPASLGRSAVNQNKHI